MAGWKMEFLLLQQDLVDRRKVSSARRTQQKATGEVLTWRKQGMKEGAGFQVPGIDAIVVVIAIEDIVDTRVKL